MENHCRYAYDRMSKQCIMFTYNGCAGNENNFESVAECSQRCPVSTTPPPGPPVTDICDLPIYMGSGYYQETRYAYKQSEQRCISFTYRGHGVNGNNFKSHAECEMKCMKKTAEAIHGNICSWHIGL
ncbi:Kunitz/Bovine pancreatic trypsin inhibitor domain protein [Oesophagostomum dentatum]|uniref:Kunitz/Bovine pancreatic trypsin inhibitor domain protein n=1 Tax=Oesophagostomum dentatum TaxID=61180 RepID=A0A0B1TDZ5_OESDE|nr:Kunitz/Bovine pancreatic trypsin inhibitor domain protein [Oesophagostomum dentatum]